MTAHTHTQTEGGRLRECTTMTVLSTNCVLISLMNAIHTNSILISNRNNFICVIVFRTNIQRSDRIVFNSIHCQPKRDDIYSFPPSFVPVLQSSMAIEMRKFPVSHFVSSHIISFYVAGCGWCLSVWEIASIRLNFTWHHITWWPMNMFVHGIRSMRNEIWLTRESKR